MKSSEDTKLFQVVKFHANGKELKGSHKTEQELKEAEDELQPR